jgi:L-rhamnose mutarotase
LACVHDIDKLFDAATSTSSCSDRLPARVPSAAGHGIGRSAVRRICFTLQVATAHIDEYRRRHAAVWPDMLVALRDAGWRDYSLFLGDDGLLVGYFVTDDLDAARAAMAATDVNQRWQREMAPFFVDLPGGRADTGMRLLDEVFHLETQLMSNGEPS